MKEAKRSLIEVIIGIWFLAVVVILAGVFFVPSKIPYVLGEVTGSLVATLMMVHLYHCLDHEMDLNRKSAVNHSRWNGFLRALIEIGVLLGSFYIAEWIMPYTVLAGLFGRKFAPFLVPVMELFRLRNETGDSANDKIEKGE